MKIFTCFIVSLSLAVTLTLAYGIGQAEQTSAKNKNPAAIKTGAQMYDNWLKFADYQPVGIIHSIPLQVKNLEKVPGAVRNATVGTILVKMVVIVPEIIILE